MKRTAIVRISNELLHHLLKLPEDAKVVDFSRDLFFFAGDYALRVESQSFPQTEPGMMPLTLEPLYRNVDGLAEFVGWNGLPEETRSHVVENCS